MSIVAPKVNTYASYPIPKEMVESLYNVKSLDLSKNQPQKNNWKCKGVIGLLGVVTGCLLLKKSRFIGLPSESKIIKNFHTVDKANNVYRGPAILTEEAAQELINKKGVTKVINLIGNNPDMVKKEAQILNDVAKKYNKNVTITNIHMRSDKAPTPNNIKDFFSAIDDKSSNGGVYFHCKSGIDRTGIMAALYKLKNNPGAKVAELYNEMKDFGYNIHHQRKFKAQKNYLNDPSQPWKQVINSII